MRTAARTLVGFLHCGVGKAYHDEHRQVIRNVDLDRGERPFRDRTPRTP